MHNRHQGLKLLWLTSHIISRRNGVALETTADLYAISFDDRSVSALNMLEVTNDLC
jgi:hypothetical protein